jgi:LemA protein
MLGNTVVLIILGVLAVLVLGAVITIYNGLITSKNNVRKTWANIDILLQQRNEELPKLIDTCKGYMAHEKDLLNRITELRTGYASAQDLEKKVEIENELRNHLARLKLVWEQYPDLKAIQSFLQIQERVSALESKIADYREGYNDSANIFNIQIERFPDLLLAGAMRYRRQPFLEVPEEKRKDVKMDFTV